MELKDVYEHGKKVDIDCVSAYETLDPHDIGWAVRCLKTGMKVSRKGWNGKGMWLELQVPDEHSKMTLPYVYMKTAQGDLVPWLCSQTDLLAKDWIVVE